MSDYTVCAYMRLSDEDRDIFGRKVESGSITSQRRLIMDYINKQPEFRGCNVIERCDDGLSGRYFDTRPQFTEMIELAKRGKINCIIVKDCSRFGRDYVELGNYLEQLFPFLGVRFIAINDHYDSKTCEGGLDIAFKNLVYDIYSRDLSKKGMESKRQMAKQGKYTAGQVLYGYRKKKEDRHKLELDPEAANVVREIFDMRLAGIGLTGIARNLNERDIKCPTVYRYERGEIVNHKGNFENMCWTSSAIYQVLLNENYTGAVVNLKSFYDKVSGKFKRKTKDEWIKVEGMHEAIVTPEEFRTVQESFSTQASHKPYRKMHYRCGICGGALNRRNRDDLYCMKGYSFGYWCDCRLVKAKEPNLDNLVLNSLKEKLQHVMEAEGLRLNTNNDKRSDMDVLKSLERALESAKKVKQSLFEKLADRSIDREIFKAKKDEQEKIIADLKQKISNEKVAEKLVSDEYIEAKENIETAKTFLELESMTDDTWDKFIDDVILYPDDRVEIHWSFDEA